MQYINPFELLGITSENLSDISSAVINRAKRKLLADIELSDTNTIVHLKVELNKGDCLKAIDDLDNKDKKEFHFFIYQHKHLERFLTNGELSFFYNYQAESIYKLPEFLNFISQYFTEQYDKILLANYKLPDREAVAQILSVIPITTEAYYEKCYRSTYAFVKDIDNEIKDIIKEIANTQSPFISMKFIGLDYEILEKVNVKILNLLPSYFQRLRNQLAFSIRNLAVNINNDPYNLYEPAFKIVDIANNISTDSLTKRSITKNYHTIKKNYTNELDKLQSQEQAAREQILSDWRRIANQIENVTKIIAEGEKTATQRNLFFEVELNGNRELIPWNFSTLANAINQIADPFKLNALSGNFQSVRNRVGEEVLALAKTLNNEPYHNYKVAYDLISIAYSINLDGEVADNVFEASQSIKRNFDKQISQQQIALKSKQDEDLAKLKLQKKVAADNQVIAEWRDNAILIENITKEILDGVNKFIPTDFFSLDSLINQIADPSKLNALSAHFQSVRNHVANKVCALAKAINNDPYRNYKIAFSLIDVAQKINTDGDVAEIIRNTYQSIKRNFDRQINLSKNQSESIYNTIPNWTTTNKKEEPIHKKERNLKNIINLKPIVLLRIALFIFIIIVVFAYIFNNETTSSVASTQKIASTKDDSKSISNNSFASTVNSYSNPLKIEESKEEEYIRSFKADGDKYDIEELESSSFLGDYPDAKEFHSFNIGGDTVDVPVNQSDAFRAKYPMAKPLHNYNFDIPSEKLKQIYEGLSQKKPDLKSEGYDSFADDMRDENNLKAVYELISRGNPKLQTLGFVNFQKEMFPNQIKHPFEGVNTTNEAKYVKDNSNTYIIPTSPKPVFNFPLIANGDLTGCFSNIQPKYNKKLDNKLITSCGNNADAALKMIDCATDKSIRYVYIRKNTTYTILNIPEGRYYLKIAYGSNWGVRAGEPDCDGKFTTNALYKKGEEILNYNITYDADGSSHWIDYSLKLNVIYPTNDMNTFSTNNISENDFYNE